jgi:phosphoribosyl 1,2-cyclic phosphate phosphodiesterase
MRITFLGTGTSHGVPSIDCMLLDHAPCKKGVCVESETDPKHRRTRSSILIEWNERSLLIDASLDFRQQALREKIKRIDAVLITHKHADHIGGIPDLRSYNRQGKDPLPLYGSSETINAIQKNYAYIFDSGTFIGGGIPNIKTFSAEGPFSLAGKEVIPIRVNHGALDGCFGYRLGGLVYIPDLKAIAPEEIEKCAHADLLILNCLRDQREHATHLILPESITLARLMKPKRCLFIHMCHDIHYLIDGKKLDSWMDFTYDGMKVEI